MRMNKTLASTLFAGLLVTTAFFTPAMGQEQSLKPVSNWTISKVDRTGKSGSSYCTLTRKYDGDVVLSLGRNVSEEYSIAIDFQKPVFEKDTSVKINLQPGPGQIRAYDLMPSSDKAIVVRLGWDNGFFETLNKSQQMKAKLADKEYAFAMPEISKGQTDLTNCMQSLQASAKPLDKAANAPQTKDVLTAEPVKASSEFIAQKADDKVAAAVDVKDAKEQVEKEEKSILQGFADSLRAQEPSLKNEDDAPKRKNFNTKTAKADKADEPAPKRQKPVVPDPVIQKAEAPQKTQAPLPPVASATEMMDAVPPPPVEVLPPVAEVAPVKKNAAKEKELAAIQSQEKFAREEAQRELEQIQAEKKALEVKLAQANVEKEKSVKAEDVAATQAKARELEIKNAQLEENLRSAQVRIAEAAVNTESKSLRKIADLEVKLNAAQKDNGTLAKQLESYRLQQEDGKLSLVAGDWDLEQATKRFNEAEREIRRLGLQLETERSSCNREKSTIEQMLFDPAVTDKKQIERLNQLQAELDDARIKVADQQKQIQKAVDLQLVEKTKTIETEKMQLAAQVATLQKNLDARNADVANLQKTASEVAVAKESSASLSVQIAELQKSIASKDAELVALKAKPDLSGQMATLAQQIAAKDAELAAVKAKPDLSGQIATLTQQIAAKDAELAVLKGKPDEAPRVASLTQQNKMLADTLATKEKELAAAKAVPVPAPVDPSIQKQLDDLRVSQSAIKIESDKMNDQNIALRTENEKLRLQMAETVGNDSTRADRLASMQLELDNLKRQIAMKDNQTATYQNQMAVLQQEAAQLKTRISTGAGSAVSAPSMPAIPSPAPIAAASYNAIQSAAGAVAAPFDASNISGLLQKAGLNGGNVQKTGAGFSTSENYVWTGENNVRGMASIKPAGGAMFDQQVEQYFAYHKQQCGAGDFAYMASPSNGSAARPMALYEMACVKGGENVAASLIFFEDQGKFIAIANQIGAADMDLAMDNRDRIASFVRGM